MNVPLLDERKYVRIKVSSLGDSGCGKSCLIKRYCEKKFVSKYIPTIGVDFGVRSQLCKPTPSSTSVEAKVNFFDFSGSEEYSGIRDELLSDSQCFLLVCDASDVSTWKHIVDIWLPLLDKANQSKVPIAICINKVVIFLFFFGLSVMTDFFDVGRVIFRLRRHHANLKISSDSVVTRIFCASSPLPLLDRMSTRCSISSSLVL